MESSLSQAFAGGKPFPDFVAGMVCHRREIVDHYERLELPPEQVQSLGRLGRRMGPVHALVVTEDWCIDSVLNLPVLQRITEAVPELSVKIVKRSCFAELVEQRPGRNRLGRIPTVIFFRPGGQEIGYWSERCRSAHRWFDSFVETCPMPELSFIGGVPVPELDRWMKLRFARERAIFYEGMWLEVVEEMASTLAGGEVCTEPTP